jgi:C4-dicarboxylate transporter, DctM subunit
VLTCGNILFIVYAAFIFSYAISLGGIGESLTATIVDLKLSWTQFFLALLALYTVLGCLVESLGMIVITVPLLYPRSGSASCWCCSSRWGRSRRRSASTCS